LSQRAQSDALKSAWQHEDCLLPASSLVVNKEKVILIRTSGLTAQKVCLENMNVLNPERFMGATQYPKKYWWVILVVVPVVGGLIAVLPGLIHGEKGADEKGKGGVTQVGNGNVSGNGNIVGNDLSKKTYFITVESIAREVKESGQTLSEEMKAQIQKAIDLSLAGKSEESIRSWRAISAKVDSPSIEYNVAIANQNAGNVDGARAAFKKALDQKPDFEAARSSLAQLDTASSKSSGVPALAEEAEPNDQISQANTIALNTGVQGSVAKASDRDFFKFTTPPVYRDVIRISLENKSSTLRPSMAIYDARKSDTGHGTYNPTPGADLEKSFVAEPQATFYVAVGSFGDSEGAYKLLVEPQKSYDKFEPNEDILSATPIELGKKIDANMMDVGDKDFYKLKAPVGKKSFKAVLHNLSTILRPQVASYDGQKTQINSTYKTTPGADLTLAFETAPGEDFYVEVNSFGDSSGNYSLIVE
jgi:tetratricopeptide (TPR) repeat protein